MQSDPQYDDVVAEVARSLQESMRTALDRGVASEQLMIDPGIGFGKTIDHNLDLIRRLPELERLERPILVGASRKSFLGQILAGPEPAASPVPVDERLEGSLGVHVAAAMAGAHVIRAHDVRETAKILRVIDTLVETRPFESPPRPL